MRNFAVTTVITAASITKARSLFESHGIAGEEGMRWVVVTDRNLPDGTGDDLARDFKAASKRVVMLGLTGDGTTADVASFQASGCDAVMVKPVDIRRLARWLPRREAPQPPLTSRIAVAAPAPPLHKPRAGGGVGASAVLGGSHIYGTTAMTRFSVSVPHPAHGVAAGAGDGMHATKPEPGHAADGGRMP